MNLVDLVPEKNDSGVAQFKSLTDRILAYSFKYPVEVGDFKLSLVLSRKPERYSSAAPLTADARQRIVAELVDLRHSVTISVTVRHLFPHQMSPPPPICQHASFLVLEKLPHIATILFSSASFSVAQSPGTAQAPGSSRLGC